MDLGGQFAWIFHLIPIALYGDTTYNKDTLRKLMSNGSSLIPGSSTINFDEISQKRIFDSIDSAKMDRMKDLKNDYELLKYKLGRIPMMIDFEEHGSRDPQLYVNYSKSYFNFVAKQETELHSKLNASQKKYLEFVSMEIANAKRTEEVVILKSILNQNEIEIDYLKSIIKDEYDINLSEATLESCIRNINFDFIRKPQKIIKKIGSKLVLESEFKKILDNEVFINYFKDVLNYAEKKFKKQFSIDKYIDGFILYKKYSRKDVCRILNWEFNEEATVYGYKIKYNTCPIFVNYHKEDGIAAAINFPEKFNNNNEFLWYTKSNRKLTSKDVGTIRKNRNDLKFPFFVKKSNGQGGDFYYMGNVIPLEESFTQTTIMNDNQKEVPIVQIMLLLNNPVEDSVYNYITNE